MQDLLGEDELAKVLANMGEYGQSSSPSDLHAEEEPQVENAPEESHAKEAEEENLPVHDENMIGDAEQEQSIPSQQTPEEISEETGAEKDVSQEITEPVRVLAPKQPEQSNEEAPQRENQEVSHNPSCIEQPAVAFKEIQEIKELRKEQQGLLNIIVQLH